MPRQLSANEYTRPAAHGPKMEYVPAALVAELKAIVSIPLSSNYTTAVYSADGYYDIAVGLTSTQAGAINLLQSLDQLAEHSRRHPVSSKRPTRIPIGRLNVRSHQKRK
jgi:hypothetical protein